MGGVTRIMERKRLFIIGGVILGAMLLVLLLQLLFAKSGALVVIAPKTSPINVTVLNRDADYNTTFLVDAGARQEIRLKPGSYRVDSSLGGLRSVDIVEISLNETKTLEVSFAAISSATKISEALDGCPQVVANNVYDYNCMGEGFIFRLDGQGTKEILFDSQYYHYLWPYRDGFIGLPQDGTVNYVNLAASTSQPLYLPQEISASSDDLQQLQIITPSDQTKDYFVVSLNSANAAYLYKNTADTNPTRIKISQNDEYMNSISFKDDRLIIFSGPVDDPHEGEFEVRSPGSTSGGKIIEYSLDGKVKKTLDTPKDFTADRLIKLNNEYYAADRIEGTEIFYLEGDELKSIYTVDDIAGLANVGNKLYIQADNAINVFRPGEGGEFSIKSVHTPSDSQTLNGIFTGPGYLIFSATIPGIDVANVYKLDD
jgi:hypothetical protein